HRAFSDAWAIYEFYTKAQESIDQNIFLESLNKALKKPTLPINLASEVLESLPESSGVYIFYGEDNYPLYVGKSVNIKDRVLSHFSNDHSSLTDLQISQEIKRIETIKTAGELGALLLE